MPGKVLGLQIDSDAVTAVVVKSGFTENRIIACGRAPLAEGGIQEALQILAGSMDLGNDAAFVSAPAEQAALNNITMPFSDPRKVLLALPCVTETLIPFAVDTMVTDFITRENAPEPRILAASVSSETVSGILSGLRSIGVRAHALDLECVPTVAWLLEQEGTSDNGVFFNVGFRRHTMVLFKARRVALVRSFSAKFDGGGSEKSGPVVPEAHEILARRAFTTMHAFGEGAGFGDSGRVYLSGPGLEIPETADAFRRHLGVEVEEVDVLRDRKVRLDKAASGHWNPLLMTGAVALALRSSRKGMSFDFRKAGFVPAGPLPAILYRLKTAGFLLALSAVFLSVQAAFEYDRLEKRHESLESGMREIFMTTFPASGPVFDPLRQMRAGVDDDAHDGLPTPHMDPSKGVLAVLADLSRHVPEKMDVRISSLTIDGDTVRISGRTGNFNMVDGIKNSLESSAHFSGVTISSARVDRSGSRVRFDLRLPRTGKGVQ